MKKRPYWISIDDDAMDYLKDKAIKWVDSTPNDLLRRLLLNEKEIQKGIKENKSIRSIRLHYMSNNQNLNIIFQVIERIKIHKIPRNDVFNMTAFENDCSVSKINKLINNVLELSMSEFDSLLENDLSRMEYKLYPIFRDYDKKIEGFFAALDKTIKIQNTK